MAVKNRLIALMGEKQAKLNRKITISEIAEETGVSRETLYQWKRNDMRQIRTDTIEALCEYFNCDIGKLLYIDSAENQSVGIPT